MKKIITFTILVLCLFFAAKAVMWGARFMRTATLNSSDGRTNILILGVGGGTHEGADLTDTIIVLSLDMTKKTVALLSIPRDIWSETLKDKVNTAYHYGELKQKGGGLLLAKVIMEDVIGMPIHYALVIDFSGFTKVIDAVGGIAVNVPEAFTDTQYPKPGMEQATCPGDPTNACVYETVHFDAGNQHMDGARALIYARSRHAEGDQGTDFARGRRQQIIMVALRDRFTHPTEWVTLSRLQALPKLLGDATDMDMTITQALMVGRQFASVSQDQINKIAFDQLLENPPAYLYNSLYVLAPKTSWEDVHAYIKQELDN
jgi:polyisoprenyl-teichoic acid--peptidoglycan teichoic acid transferase